MIILSQCFGQLSSLAFNNGLMFNYFDHLGSDDSTIFLLMKMPSLVGMLLILPLAYLSDKYGKKKLGQWGNAIQVVGFGSLLFASWFTGLEIWVLFIGVFVFAFGVALFNSSWFALMDPLIEAKKRGSFFARMRFYWKMAGVLFTFLTQYLLEVGGMVIITELIIIVTVFSIVRMYFYHNIPELEKPDKEAKKSVKFKEEFRAVLADSKFRRFLSFKFCFPLMTGCVGLIFNLYEKKFLGFSPGDIVLMGNLIFIGNISGLWFGAKLSKILSEVRIFLICTITMTTLCLLYPLHQYVPGKVIYFVGVITFFYGAISAVFGIAMTSLMLSLLQPERKSLASSCCICLAQFGQASSGIVAASIVRREWAFVEQVAGYSNIYMVILLCSVIPLPFVTWFLTRRLNVN